MWIQNRNNGASSSKNPGYGSAKRLLKIVSRQQDVYLQYDGNIESGAERTGRSAVGQLECMGQLSVEPTGRIVKQGQAGRQRTS